jgi:hypothetical protein
MHLGLKLKAKLRRFKAKSKHKSKAKSKHSHKGKAKTKRHRIRGCTEPTACNYNYFAQVDDGSCLYYDCNGDCGGTAVLDCNNDCGGTAVVDNCGVCGGDGTSCTTYKLTFYLIGGGADDCASVAGFEYPFEFVSHYGQPAIINNDQDAADYINNNPISDARGENFLTYTNSVRWQPNEPSEFLGTCPNYIVAACDVFISGNITVARVYSDNYSTWGPPGSAEDEVGCAPCV